MKTKKPGNVPPQPDGHQPEIQRYRAEIDEAASELAAKIRASQSKAIRRAQIQVAFNHLFGPIQRLDLNARLERAEKQLDELESRDPS